jgi:LCP family protein required for cell wall assembly
MLLSIDPDTGKAYLLSIPRDFYAVIPGQGRDRINTAFVYGATGNNPEGGAQLAMQTVEYNLGVPVHHYLLVDFTAVVGGIDSLGGIDIFVPQNISDPTFPDMDYGYDPLFIPAGQHHFDGTMALKYARTRHQDNDYGRAQRQQQLIMAVRDKVMALGVAEMIARAPLLYRQLSSGIRTDLSIQDMISLAKIASDISEENIQRAVLDQEYLYPYRNEKGASVLVPMNEKIAPLIQSFFYD